MQPTPPSSTENGQDNTDLLTSIANSDFFSNLSSGAFTGVFCAQPLEQLSEEQKKQSVADIIKDFIDGNVTVEKFTQYKSLKESTDLVDMIKEFATNLKDFHWDSKEAVEIKKLLKEGNQMPIGILDEVLNKHHTDATWLKKEELQNLVFFLAFHSGESLGIKNSNGYKANSDAKSVADKFIGQKNLQDPMEILKLIVNYECPTCIHDVLKNELVQTELSKATNNWNTAVDFMQFWTEESTAAKTRFQALNIVKAAVEVLTDDQKTSLDCKIHDLVTTLGLAVETKANSPAL